MDKCPEIPTVYGGSCGCVILVMSYCISIIKKINPHVGCILPRINPNIPPEIISSTSPPLESHELDARIDRSVRVGVAVTLAKTSTEKSVMVLMFEESEMF